MKSASPERSLFVDVPVAPGWVDERQAVVSSADASGTRLRRSLGVW